ncbi:MAG: hypothetical protein IT379_03805, partial [Deltaproteobacteria bacterium]|nr:hypothetical protein [Deltaproteobacteria bacterium]
WDDDRAPFVMRDTDALFVRWVSLGAGRSAVGWPTSAPQWHGIARVLWCTRGAFVEHPMFGIQLVGGTIYASWSQAGAIDGSLGAPTSEAIAGAEPGSVTQRFERGVLAWSPTRGPS